MAPYRPQTWALGGRPTVGIDIPVTAVFLALYIGGAITHMTIFQLNRRRGHKFLMSGLLFGFCMARTTTAVLRIASISRPSNTPLLIAATIFVAAGIVLLYIINLVFTQRIIRAQHPHIGWHTLLHWFFVAIYALVPISLVMLITTVVQSYYTLDPDIRQIDRGFMLYGGTTFAIVSVLPIPLVILSGTFPRRSRIDKFGSGRFRTKIAVLLTATTLVSAGAWWRMATSWKTAVPMTQPLPWYLHRVYFYIFNFGVEVLVIYLYAFLRIDLRFHVPDGASGPGHYSGGAEATTGKRPEGESGAFRVYTEEETFDGEDDEAALRSADPQKGEKGLDADLEKGVEHEPGAKSPVLRSVDVSFPSSETMQSHSETPATPETNRTESTLRSASDRLHGS